MKNEAITIPFHIIGHIRSKHEYPWQLPRQGVLARNHEAVIELNADIVPADSLRELNGFDRLWVVFVFHKAESSRAVVTPPGIGRKSIGVFATRSPHRVNPIGLSCVRLHKVDGHHMYISESDMMDGSPILDIKPYISYADSFETAAPGWTSQRELNTWSVDISDSCKDRLQWILEYAGLDLTSAIYAQLSDDPFNSRRKRVALIQEDAGIWQLSCRTWRILFSPNAESGTLCIESVRSGYGSHELQDEEDKYHDKHIHRQFNDAFASDR